MSKEKLLRDFSGRIEINLCSRLNLLETVKHLKLLFGADDGTGNFDYLRFEDICEEVKFSSVEIVAGEDDKEIIGEGLSRQIVRLWVEFSAALTGPELRAGICPIFGENDESLKDSESGDFVIEVCDIEIDLTEFTQ